MSKWIVNEGGAVHEVADDEAANLLRGRDPLNGKPNSNLGVFREASKAEVAAAKKATAAGEPYLATGDDTAAPADADA